MRGELGTVHIQKSLSRSVVTLSATTDSHQAIDLLINIIQVYRDFVLLKTPLYCSGLINLDHERPHTRQRRPARSEKQSHRDIPGIPVYPRRNGKCYITLVWTQQKIAAHSENPVCSY